MKSVAIIVGHSKTSQGALNPNNGITEFEYNTALADLITDQLQKCAAVNPIIIYRDSYWALPTKVNETEAGIAISLHCNAFNTQATGSEVLYWDGSKEGAKLAKEMQQAAVGALGLKDRGITTRKMGGRGAYILHETKMPCVIVEPFFIDNDSDLAIAVEKQQALAVRYARAIEGYLR